MSAAGFELVSNAAIQELTTAIASGDTEAFGRFYESWFDEMYGQARRATRLDEASCLDIVQEAMLRVIRSLPPMSDEARLRAWLGAVVRSCACDHLRGELRRKRRQEACARGATERRGEEGQSATDIARQLEWLREQMAEMEHEQVQLLTMRHRFGWTLHRVGAAVGLSPGAVDGRLNRIVSALRRRAIDSFKETDR